MDTAPFPDLPRVRAIECFDPLDLLPALARLRFPFLLHSTLQDARGRWSFFGAEPFEQFRGRNYDIAIERWRELSARVRDEDRSATVVPFTGGIVGYWAYDFGRRLESWPALAEDDLHLPDFMLGFYDVVGAFDHESRQAWLFSSGLPYEGERGRAHAAARLDELAAHLAPAGRLPLPAPVERRAGARSTFTADAYRRAVERVRDHIARGDIYQANLSQRWTLPLHSDAASAGAAAAEPRADGPGLDAAELARLAATLHTALADRSPAPFAAFLGAPDHAVVSASPERFLEVRGRRVATRPIKGTRPRGATLDADRAERQALVTSAKDRAENVMIVDVLRNDLGRVCELGSVRTLELCELEAFAQVFHLTSAIEGRLRSDADALDLLHACFPGGSITGAPKLRAIQILEALEPVRRHVYTGAIGYVDWRGDADWSIAIRTALVTPRAIHYAAGGGITTDSDPAAEYQETLHKAAGMEQALAAALGLQAGAIRVGA